MQYLDIHNKELKKGDIIDLHQTVNGQSQFVVNKIEPISIIYLHDLSREYEYDKEELLSPSLLSGDVEWEIVGNIYDLAKSTNSSTYTALTDEEKNLLMYFWSCYQDLSRYAEFERLKPQIEKELPLLMKAWNDYKSSIDQITLIFNSL